MSKKKTYQDVVIDGSTLEKRRDQRAEQLERFVGELDEEDRKGFVGKVNQWTQSEGVRVVDASQSVFDLEAENKKLRTDVKDTHTFELPPIAKRTPDERVTSFAKRMIGADPLTVEPILKQVQGEYWKAGMPVTMDDLRQVATHFLNEAERKKRK